MADLNNLIKQNKHDEIASFIIRASFDRYKTGIKDILGKIIDKSLGGIAGLTLEEGVNSMREAGESYYIYIERWVWFIEMLNTQRNIRNANYGTLYASTTKPNLNMYRIVVAVAPNNIPAVELVAMAKLAGFRTSYIGSRISYSPITLFIFKKRN